MDSIEYPSAHRSSLLPVDDDDAPVRDTTTRTKCSPPPPAPAPAPAPAPPSPTTSYYAWRVRIPVDNFYVCEITRQLSAHQANVGFELAVHRQSDIGEFACTLHVTCPKGSYTQLFQRYQFAPDFAAAADLTNTTKDKYTRTFRVPDGDFSSSGPALRIYCCESPVSPLRSFFLELNLEQQRQKELVDRALDNARPTVDTPAFTSSLTQRVSAAAAAAAASSSSSSSSSSPLRADDSRARPARSRESSRVNDYEVDPARLPANDEYVPPETEIPLNEQEEEELLRPIACLQHSRATTAPTPAPALRGPFDALAAALAAPPPAPAPPPPPPTPPVVRQQASPPRRSVPRRTAAPHRFIDLETSEDNSSTSSSSDDDSEAVRLRVAVRTTAPHHIPGRRRNSYVSTGRPRGRPPRRAMPRSPTLSPAPITLAEREAEQLNAALRASLESEQQERERRQSAAEDHMRREVARVAQLPAFQDTAVGTNKRTAIQQHPTSEEEEEEDDNKSELKTKKKQKTESASGSSSNTAPMFTCSICCNTTNQMAMLIPADPNTTCGHVYCRACTTKTFVRFKACPNCKTPVRGWTKLFFP